MKIVTTLPAINHWLSSLRSTERKENQLVEEALSILYTRLRKKEDFIVNEPSVVKRYMSLQLLGKEQEVFVCLFLDSQHRLIESRDIFYGTIDACSVYPREVIKVALSLNASALVFAHNHPSGDANPSEADKRITETLAKAAILFGINVLDHLIVGENEVVSFAELGLV